MSRRADRDRLARETRELTQQMERRLGTMETVLIIREPTSTVAADAYDGLRKQLVGAVQARQAHLAQLVQFATALRDGADVRTLGAMVDGWLESANVVTVHDPGGPDADVTFRVVEDLGGDLEVLAPAFVDGVTGRVVRQGLLRRHPPGQAAPPTAAPATGPDHREDNP